MYPSPRILARANLSNFGSFRGIASYIPQSKGRGIPRSSNSPSPGPERGVPPPSLSFRKGRPSFGKSAAVTNPRIFDDAPPPPRSPQRQNQRTGTRRMTGYNNRNNKSNNYGYKKVEKKSSAMPPVRISVGRRGLHIDELSALLGVDSGRILKATAGLIDGKNEKILPPEVIELVVESLDLSHRVTLEQSKPLWNNDNLTCKSNPVITIMGHVDHGKTSLLDSLRGKGVRTVEHGGITQSIGAFQVGNLTFIDTPGHAAFFNMRQRGSIATDIIILVIAADDGIMPQTLEVINLAKISDVPLIVAINKMDKVGANSDRIRAQLLEVAGINSEQTGGDTLCVEVSAKTNHGLDNLLDSITLQAEMLPDSASENNAEACMVCIESNCDRSMGNIASVIVRDGTVKVGDFILFHDDDILAGDVYGKIRSLIDVNGKPVQEASAGAAVSIVGIRARVPPGSMAVVVKNETEAKKESKAIIARNQRILATVQSAQQKLTELHAMEKAQKAEDSETDDIDGDRGDGGGEEEEETAQADEEAMKGTLNVLVKGDVQGSSDAVANCLRQLSTKSYGIRVISAGMGAVTQADILMASATTKYKRRTDDSIIVCFNVKTPNSVLGAAKRVHVDVLSHQLIYELEDAVRERVERNLAKWETAEKVVGSAKVVRVFNDGGIGGLVVAGGKISRDTQTRVWRTNKHDHERVCVHTGNIGTLKHLSKDIRVAQKGTECGIAFEDWNDFQAGDIIECSEVIKGENVA